MTVELYFCELCSQSIPLSDAESSRAVRIADKWVCSGCCARAEAATRAHPASVSSVPARSSASLQIFWALSLAVLSVAAALAMTIYVRRQVGAMQREVARVDPAQAERVRRLGQQLDGIEARLERWFDDTWARAEAARVQGAPVSSNGDSPEGARIEPVAAQLALVSRALEDLAQSSHVRIDELRSRADALEQRLALLGAARSPAVDVAAAPETLTGARKELVDALRHPEPARRARALIELGARGDAADLPFIASMLRDGDAFVRVTAVRLLEAARAKPAVGPLIEALEDPESTVRMAADSALRALTGQRFLFDPWARADLRAAGVQEWRDWWSRSWREFLFDAASSR